MEITFYGHACFGLEICGKHILIDPFISGNPLAKDININEVKADYILITHAHQDHVLDVEVIAKRTGAIIVSNYEIVNYFTEKGIESGFGMNHGGTFKTPEFSAKYVNAVHTSSFANQERTYGGQPGGFVIKGEGKAIYVAGDTALTMDMKLIPMQTKLDIAILPIGDTFTMGVDDAILASDFVECDKVVGCHFNTFPPIEIDIQEAKAKFSAKGKDLVVMSIGECFHV